MPGFHVPETVAGGLAGAGTGYLYHRWAERNKPHKKGDALQRYKLRSRLLKGTLLGALTGDVAGDRLRRLLSNSPTLAGYNAGDVAQGMTRDGVSGLWRGAVLDKPLHMRPTDYFYESGKGGNWGEAPLMRRELLRRSLGVHSEGANDWFQDAGSIVGADGRKYPKVELNRRFYDNPAGALDSKAVNIFKILWGDKGGYGFTDMAGSTSPLRMSDVFAGFPTEQYGNVRRLTDYWDFDLSPTEKAIGIRMAADVARDPNRWHTRISDPLLAFQLLRKDGGTIGQGLTSLALRKFFNDVVATKAPVFDQLAVMPTAHSSIKVPRMLSSVKSFTQGGPDRDKLIELVGDQIRTGIVEPTQMVLEKAKQMEGSDISKYVNILAHAAP